MLAGLTTVLRYRAGPGLASSLNALEFSAMIGVLAGVSLVALLPRAVPWSTAFLLACAPVLVPIVTLPLLRRSLPSSVDGPRPLFARSEADEPPSRPSSSRLAILAGVAGTAIALSYSAVDQFVIPLRGSREFGLERAGIARLLMLSQLVDIVALLPVGALADRYGTPRVVAAIMLTFTAALTLIGFGTLPLMAVGCGLFGLSMAGWMLPLGNPPVGHPAGPGGVAARALSGVGRRRHVPRAGAGRSAHRAARRRPAGGVDRGDGGAGHRAAGAAARYCAVAVSRTALSPDVRSRAKPRICRITLWRSDVAPPSGIGRPLGTTTSVAASMKSIAPDPSAAM